MRNAIIVHGMPSREEYYSEEFPACSNYHWLPWLQNVLIINDIKADTPEMPHAYLPEYSVWKKEFERFDITDETILVGHSCGAGFIVKWLSENPDVEVGRVILVAPWIDPENELSTGFFDFKMDKDLKKRTKGVSIFNSSNDFGVIQESVKRIRAEIEGIGYVEFQDHGHFCAGDMDSEKFHEVLWQSLL